MSEFESSFKSDRDSAMNIRMFKHRVRVRVRTVKKRISFFGYFCDKTGKLFNFGRQTLAIFCTRHIFVSFDSLSKSKKVPQYTYICVW